MRISDLSSDVCSSDLALAAHGYRDWRQPALSELKADGLLSQGFPEYGAGSLRVRIQLLPGSRCPGAGCMIQALVYSTRAVLHKRSGLVDRQTIAQWLLAAQGMGGPVNPRAPSRVRGPEFGFPNPPDAGIPAMPVAKTAMAVPAAHLEGSRVFRVGADGEPHFH